MSKLEKFKNLSEKQKQRIRKQIAEIYDTDFMKKYNDDKWLDYLKKNYQYMDREERLQFLIKRSEL